jgi:hypothetical protein
MADDDNVVSLRKPKKKHHNFLKPDAKLSNAGVAAILILIVAVMFFVKLTTNWDW